MARSIAIIKAQILAAVQAEAALAGLTSPSQTALYTSWIFIQAVTINLFEQVQDVYKAALEALLAKSFAATPLWIQDQTFKFQYSSTIPQVVQVLSDGTAGYPIVDASLRIISQCSVGTDFNNKILVKVATGSPPGPVGATPLGQLQGYLTAKLPAGLLCTATSGDADKLSITADVYYDGQYSGIQELVELAITNYLANIPFNGLVRVSQLENAILEVLGGIAVLDVKINTVKCRADITAFGSATLIYDLATGVNIKEWPTVTGYIVEETTVGYLFADTITYIPKSN